MRCESRAARSKCRLAVLRHVSFVSQDVDLVLTIRSVLEDMTFSQASNEGTFSLTASDELQFDWRIPPSRLKICRYPDGSDWKLGSGGFGTVSFSATPSIDVMKSNLHAAQ